MALRLSRPQERTVKNDFAIGTHTVYDGFETSGVEAAKVKVIGIERPLLQLGKYVRTQRGTFVFRRSLALPPGANVADAAIRFRFLPEITQQHTTATTLGISAGILQHGLDTLLIALAALLIDLGRKRQFLLVYAAAKEGDARQVL